MALDTIPKQEGGKLKAVASGTLPSGQPVVVNADGTVSVISASAIPESLGTATTFYSSGVEQIASVYDSDSGKVIIAYKAVFSSGRGEAVVGTVSGTSISFGSATTFETSEVGGRVSLAYDASAQRVVAVYNINDLSSICGAVVGTVSGNSISFGSRTTFGTNFSGGLSCVFDPSSDKVVIFYVNGDDDRGRSVVGTVSGTSISFGSAVTFETGETRSTRCAAVPSAGCVVVSYFYGGSTQGAVIVGTVSGTSISFGSRVIVESASTGNNADGNPVVATNTANTVAVAHNATTSSSGAPKVSIGTISGTSISFSGAVQVEGVASDSIAMDFGAASNKLVVAYQTSAAGRYAVGSFSGGSLSFSSPASYDTSGRADTTAVTYDGSSGNFVISRRQDPAQEYGYSSVLQTEGSNLTSENYIGISTGGAVADTGNATIDIVGTVNKEQSGLTPGQQYYVQTDGTVGTTPADPSVLAGTAVSATKMVVKS